ncbi:MAG: thiamine-phosphate kinase, partial [Dehalococcoidia bacterium]
GARLWADNIPVNPFVKAAFKDESLALAVSGGEDYELLFTASEAVMDRVLGLIQVPVTVIGDVVSDNPGQVILLDERDEPLAWEQPGWDHFSTPL